jgi:hypothetical protein
MNKKLNEMFYDWSWKIADYLAMRDASKAITYRKHLVKNLDRLEENDKMKYRKGGLFIQKYRDISLYFSRPLAWILGAGAILSFLNNDPNAKALAVYSAFIGGIDIMNASALNEERKNLLNKLK